MHITSRYPWLMTTNNIHDSIYHILMNRCVLTLIDLYWTNYSYCFDYTKFSKLSDLFSLFFQMNIARVWRSLVTFYNFFIVVAL